ncbi:hypothetical protein ATO4_16255 [Aurantimonas sp. 22II-16-19i]|nr:hypothetical protein ATO4_16255 [Aurantimonas sp. 22II-16-19i]
MAGEALIVIVDDDASALEAALGLVRSLGFEVRGYRSGREFLTSGSVEETRCLVVDWRMPGMNGLELHRTLTEAGHTIATVLVTAFPEEGAVRAQAEKVGIRCILSKPLEADVLHAFIRKALAD